MKWQQSQYNAFEGVDEHNQPTEPMMPVFLPPSATVAGGTPTNADDVLSLPAPQPHERPFPYQAISNNATPHRSQQPAGPVINNGGRQSPGDVPPAQPIAAGNPVQTTGPSPRRSSWPLSVGLFFVTVQLLLLVRFVLKLFALAESTAWIGLIYTISGIFVLPFRLLLQNILPFSQVLEIYTLLAILVYGLLSRLLVRLLKAVLR